MMENSQFRKLNSPSQQLLQPKETLQIQDQNHSLRINLRSSKGPKTKFQLDRIRRGGQQRMFIIKLRRRQDQQIVNMVEFRIEIYSSTKTVYKITISKELYCSCPDFQKHRKPCKHIYFIFIRIAKSKTLCNRIRNSRKLSNYNLLKFNQIIYDRLQPRIKEQPSQLYELSDCCICHAQINTQQDLFQCFECHNKFHLLCSNQSKLYKTTCPMCKNTFYNALDLQTQQRNFLAGDLGRNNPLKRLWRVDF